MTPCPMCSGREVVLLGELGRLIHVTCRSCGWEWSERADTAPWGQLYAERMLEELDDEEVTT